MAVVNIKGINGNLVFVFEDGSIDECIEYLKNKFEEAPRLFSGSPVVFSGDALNNFEFNDIATLQKLCLDNGMVLNNTHTKSKAPSNDKNQFIYRTVRSGQSVHSKGNLVILGDVNESAEVTAGGDIIVLGKLNGIAHAGMNGDINSIIFALGFNPSQIRIANKISRNSEESKNNKLPEIAYIDDDLICVKQYNPKDNISNR